MRRKSMTIVAKLLPRGARYGAFLSIGELLSVETPRLKDAVKVQFLPQWAGEYGKAVEAVLHKRFVLMDIGASDVGREDITGIAKMARKLGQAAEEHPEELLKIATAFGRSGSKEDREAVLDRSERLGILSGDDPAAFGPLVGLGLLIGAALLASCCNETDRSCDDGDTDGDTDGDK